MSKGDSYTKSKQLNYVCVSKDKVEWKGNFESFNITRMGFLCVLRASASCNWSLKVSYENGSEVLVQSETDDEVQEMRHDKNYHNKHSAITTDNQHTIHSIQMN